MRAIVQRVSRCRVTVDSNVVGEIGAGLLVLLGINKTDSEAAADYLVEKIIGLRIFEDAGGKMNLSVQDCGGSVLVVCQSPLYGDAIGAGLLVLLGINKTDSEAAADYLVEKIIG